jgi:Protein of unknown function (DUF3489)
MRVKLTDAQLVMMSEAAQREDRCLAAPDTMKGAVLSKVSAKLIKLGFVREIRAKAGMPVWRRDDAGQGYALKLTAGGLNAIAVDEAPEHAIEPIEAPQSPPLSEATIVSDSDNGGEQAKTLAPRAGSKLARVIDLLQRSDGATIPILTEATGWLPHTARAALTGLRKRGYAVVRARVGAGDSVYRIAGAADDGDRFVVQPDASDGYDRELEPKPGQAA